MTEHVQPESKSASRRAILGGALGGIGAWALGAIGRVTPVQAQGENVQVGGSYLTATGSTTLGNLANNLTTLIALNQAGGAAIVGTAVGRSGVVGGTNAGLEGQSSDGTGVLGIATASTAAAFGMFARSDSDNAPALGARSAGNSTGVLAKSGGGAFPAAKAKTGMYGYAAQDSNSKGVWGNSPAGHGLHGESSSGWAGYFDGRVLVNRYVELAEISTPSAPGSNHAKLFIRDNGSGKTQLCVRFHTGATKVLATQP